MVTKSSYLYREDTKGWGNNPRKPSQRESLSAILSRQVQPILQPIAWDDVANWKGKNVWGLFDGTRQLLHVVSLAPEGKEGERWYVMPQGGLRLNIGSISKKLLELPKPCTALAIRPPMAIVVYVGGV